MTNSTVEHPSGYLGMDRLKKIEDTIEAMYRRKQLSGPQYAAATRYRNAFDIVAGQMGQTLDTDRARGGGNRTMGPAEAVLIAAGVLNDADKLLGVMDSALIEMVVGRGYSIEQCAQRLGGRNPDAEVTREDRLDTGKRLRMALDILAGRVVTLDRLQPAVITGWRGGKSEATDTTGVDRSRVAHAGDGKVKYTGL